MKVRTVFLMAAIVAIAGAAWFGWRYWAASRPFAGPIVFISIDTLRADRLPIYGYEKITTPAIDALATDGLVFDHAWAHSPQTLPSHASIMTGLLPFEHGVRDNMGFSLKPGAWTLAGALRSAGYATGGFVSAYVLRADVGIGQGFDAYDDRLPAASPEVAIGDVQRDGADTLAAAEAWLSSRTSSKFFLFLHLYEPHTPYAPPARYAKGDPYDGEIAYADELVGKLIATLKSRGLYDDALIVLLSDHGEGLGDHGEMEHGLFLYRETMHVPLIVKRPGRRGAGTRVAAPVQHIDLVPSLLSMIQAPVPAGLRGRSLAPVMDGGAIPEQGLYAEAMYPRYHFGWSELYSLTDARFRFIRAPRDELYDTTNDPRERRNLAGEREQTRVAMRQALDRLMAGAAIDAPGHVSAEDRERLKALGYIGMQATVDTKAGAESLPDPKDKVHVLEQYRRGLELVRNGRTSDAIPVLKAIVDENPRMADVWSEIAGLLVRQGRHKEAIEAYKRQVEVAPHDPAAIVSVVQLLVETGRSDEARAQADAALKVLPATEGRWRAAVHKMLMRMAVARNDVATARAEAELARKEDATLPLPAFLDGLIRYNAGQYAEALPYFEQVVRETEVRTFQVPDFRYYLGDTLGRLERYDEAAKYFAEEIRFFPSSLNARAGLAMVYRVQDRVDESNRAVEAILRQAPTPEGSALAEKLWTMFGESGRAAAVRAERARAAKR